jgi:YfiR/HmsC-like
LAVRRLLPGLRQVARACAALIVACMAPPALAQQNALENTVKATFVYRFAGYVAWPAGSSSATSPPVRICVLGDRAFTRVLEATVRGQTIDGRGFEATAIASADDVSGCHMLYLGAGDEVTAQALRNARNAPILTITDAVATPSLRGIVHFVLVDQRVRFHIDDALAAEAGLTVSSRLLALAVSVRRRE